MDSNSDWLRNSDKDCRDGFADIGIVPRRSSVRCQQIEYAYLRGQSRCGDGDGSQANGAREYAQDLRMHLEAAKRDCGESTMFFVCCNDRGGVWADLGTLDDVRETRWGNQKSVGKRMEEEKRKSVVVS